MAGTAKIRSVPIREWKADFPDPMYEQSGILSIGYRPRCCESAAVNNLEVVAEVFLDVQPVACHLERSLARRKSQIVRRSFKLRS